MQQPRDYNSSYYKYHQTHPQQQQQQQQQNPYRNDLPPPAPYASAPPFSTHYSSSSDYSNFSSGYLPYSQNPGPIPPTAPSYAPPPTNPNFQTFNPPPSQPPSSFPSFTPAPETQAPYLTPTQQRPYFPPYDHQQATPNYTSPTIPPNTNPHSNPNSSLSGEYLASYSHLGSSVPPTYDNPYENSVKLDQRGGYLDENSGRYGGSGGFGQTQSDLSSDFYEKRRESGLRYDRSGIRDDGL